MRHVLLAGAVMAIAAAPAAEAAAPKKAAELSVGQVGKPPATSAGATFKLAVRVANAKNRRAASGRVTVTVAARRPAPSARRRGQPQEHEGRRPPLADVLDHRGDHGPRRPLHAAACVRRGSGEGKASCRNAGTVTIVARPSTTRPRNPRRRPPRSPPRTSKAADEPRRHGANHLRAFQEAADLSGGTRASGLQGYGVTVAYVVGQLRAAGYNPTVQTFDFPFFKQLSPSVFVNTTPNPDETSSRAPTSTSMSVLGGAATRPPRWSRRPRSRPRTPARAGARRRTSTVHAGASRSCSAAPARSATRPQRPGRRRVGAVVMNQGDADNAAAGPLAGTLGQPPARIPAMALTCAAARNTSGATARVKTEPRTTPAAPQRDRRDCGRQPRQGRHRRVTPGLGRRRSRHQRQRHRHRVRPRDRGPDGDAGAPANKVRFAFWGAEEPGLIGSTTTTSTHARDRRPSKVKVNLNFDMLGSPNHAKSRLRRRILRRRSAGHRPKSTRARWRSRRCSSATSTRVGVTEPTAFDGRWTTRPSRTAAGPPAALFTGAEVPQERGPGHQWGRDCRMSPSTPTTTRPATPSPTWTSPVRADVERRRIRGRCLRRPHAQRRRGPARERPAAGRDRHDVVTTPRRDNAMVSPVERRGGCDARPGAGMT